MNKGKLIFIVALVILGAFFVNQYMAVTTGFTVNSISTDPNIITESTNLQNAKWLVTMTLDGGGQSLVGTITPSQTAQLSNYESKYPLDIRVTAIDETFTYPIKNTGRGVYKYSTEYVGAGDCVNADYVIKGYLLGLIHTTDFCIYKEQDGVVGNIDNPINRLTSTWELTADGYTTTNTIDTRGQYNVDFTDRSGQWIANAKWTGNLVTGDTPPDGGFYVATYATGDEWGTTKDNWKISHDTEYDNYIQEETKHETQFELWVDFPKEFDCDSKDNCLAIIQSKCDLINDKRNTLLGGADATIGTAQTVVDATNINAGKVEITMDDRTVMHQVVTMLIRADWLGVNIPVGQPEILSVTCPEFASGDATGLCDINVKNVGAGKGVFYATFLDCGIFEQAYPSQQITFDAGEIDNLRVFISHGTATQETDSVCTVKVIDASDSTRFDTATAMIHMTEPKTCVPNSFRVSGSCVYQCNEAGTGELEPMCCVSGEILKNDGRAEWDGWFCEILEDDDGFGFGKLIDNLLKSLFGDEFGMEDIIPLIISIIMIIVIIYLAALILPILLPLLAKAIIGLFFRSK